MEQSIHMALYHIMEQDFHIAVYYHIAVPGILSYGCSIEMEENHIAGRCTIIRSTTEMEHARAQQRFIMYVPQKWNKAFT